ncbi:snake venom 5'-nucleotidase-like [Amphiura filiformis]|uniref:snake venom 5'-nucleotidase-like n=1 Tax=Amphiura filiformis TaxID=82378 RepID=UPI003B20CD70
MGRLNVIFDEEGEVNEFYGGPILLDKDVEQDPALLARIMEWAEPINNDPNDPIVGTTDVFLQGAPRDNRVCRQQECNLGNLLADAMIWKCLESLTEEEAANTTIIAFMNGGGIRDNINEGEIRYESDIRVVLPFSNTFDSVELEGRYVREMLEQAVSTGVDSFPGWFLQVAGLKVTYDLCQEPYDGRVVDVQVLKHLDCLQSYYEPLDDDKVYKVIMPSFIGEGGDGYDVVPNEGDNYMAGDLGEDVLAEYIAHFTPVARYVEGRVTFVEGECTATTSGPTTPMAASVQSTASSATTNGGGGDRDKPRKQKP